jgi:tetratricopeptide (TPR) repeat protein
MRIYFTLTASIFSALLAFAQQPPEPPIELAPIAPLPPLPPLPHFPQVTIPPITLDLDFSGLPLFALQDTQRDAERSAREQLRHLQERSSESYSRGKSYLDRKEYDRAIDTFNQVIDSKSSRADGAYYWRAYAQNKLGHRDEALASLAELQKSYPASRWLDDAKALQVEIRSQNGQPLSPETATDEDLKLLA